MDTIIKQNGFSRSLINEAKLGAYYTDLGHCRRIGQLLSFPEEEQVLCLEPSIGDGVGILSVTKDCPNAKIYGVELNKGTYEETKKNEKLYVLNADFLNGIKVSNKAFSFCFSNPPYGTDAEYKERFEKLFAEKIFNYMAPGGILCYVIPYPVLLEIIKPFFSRFNILGVFRFDDDEYEKFHQCVVFAQRRNTMGYQKQWLEKLLPQIDQLEKLSYLPKEGEPIPQKIVVPASGEEKLVYFTTLIFDAEAASENLAESDLYDRLADKVFLKPYTATEIGHPAVPLKKDLLYLCAIAGGGQGLAGSAKNKDLHLQRGVAKVISTTEVQVDEKGQKKAVESSSTKISLSVIQNNGQITVLE